MATIYVRSTDGVNTDDGSTWALAKLDLAGAAAIDSAGDTIYVSDNHAESTATAVTIALAGTEASPSLLLCADDAAEPPTALSTAGTVTTTGASNISIAGVAYTYGLTFNAGTGASSAHLQQLPGAGGKQVHQSDTFRLVTTSASARIYLCNSASPSSAEPSAVEWRDCNVKFGNASQRMSLNMGSFEWVGGSIESGSSAITTLLENGTNSRPANMLVRGVDLSNAASSLALLPATVGSLLAVFDGLKLPASWTGNPGTSTTPGCRIEMYRSASGDTPYELWIEDFCGSIRDETTVVRTGTLASAKYNGAEVPMSEKFTANANAQYPMYGLHDTVMGPYNETTGSSQTATVHFLTFEAADIDNDDLQMDVCYMASSGSTLVSLATSAKAGVLTSASAYSADTGESWDGAATAYSAATNYVVGDIVKPSAPNGAIYRCEADAGTTSAEPTWGTTDGGTTTDAAGRTWRRCRRQKMSVSFTANEQGPLVARVTQWLASTTIYVDPEIEVA